MHTLLAETRLLEKVHFANSYKLRRQSSYFIAVYLVLSTVQLAFSYGNDLDLVNKMRLNLFSV